MTSNRKSGGWGHRLPVPDDALRDSVLRATSKDSRTFGFVLARLRKEQRLTLGEQAAALGASDSALVFLSVFRLSRAARRTWPQPRPLSESRSEFCVGCLGTN